MVINALNSGAYTYMADFEDSTSPTWANLMDGQVNMRAAIHRTIDFKQASNGKEYKLKPIGQTAVLLVRPRGWHLNEDTLSSMASPVGFVVDFGLYFFHNAHELVRTGFGRTSICPRWRATSRLVCGTTSSTFRRTTSRSAWHHPRYRSDRDHHRCL